MHEWNHLYLGVQEGEYLIFNGLEQINNNKANFQYSEIFKKPNKQKNQQNKPRKDRETIYIVLWMNIYEMLWTWTVLAQLTIEKHTLKMQSKNIWKYNL